MILVGIKTKRWILEVTRKQSTPHFLEKEHFLPPCRSYPHVGLSYPILEKGEISRKSQKLENRKNVKKDNLICKMRILSALFPWYNAYSRSVRFHSNYKIFANYFTRVCKSCRILIIWHRLVAHLLNWNKNKTKEILWN